MTHRVASAMSAFRPVLAARNNISAHRFQTEPSLAPLLQVRDELRSVGKCFELSRRPAGRLDSVGKLAIQVRVLTLGHCCLQRPGQSSSPAAHAHPLNAAGTFEALVANSTIDIEGTSIAHAAINVERIIDGHLVVSVPGK